VEEENNSSRGPASQQAVVDQSDSAPMPGEGVEPELQAIKTESGAINMNSARCDGERMPSDTCERRGHFLVQKWHRPYAEALLEADASKLRRLISEAEQAIFVRYLELHAAPGVTDESLDLQHAVQALSELKKAE
jgi:hypothetical protein